MNMLDKNLLFAASIGLLLVLPLAILEWVTASDLPRSNFPIPLFVVMWLLVIVFILVVLQIVRTARAGNIAMANPVLLVFKVVLLGLIAWSWVGLTIDQWPCFLGATGC
jgi:hypothetical protein